MSELELIENKVANSGLITLNLEELFDPTERMVLDIAPWLFRGLILKEKEFRDYVKAHDWAQYQHKFLVFECSADAIVPTWAYMLLSVAVHPFAKRYFFGSAQDLNVLLYQEAIDKIDASQYQDARVIVKGCSDIPVPVNAYVAITAKLFPVAKSIMYGEACSNVPIYKKK
jgi:hypothetical protein